MAEYKHLVTHAWQRRHVLNQWRAGELLTEDVCDADFLLVTAAKFHGGAVATPCPICERPQLYNVLWVYGDEIGRASGSARSWDEIEQFAAQGKSFRVHTVEVCTGCRWNHLLQTTIVSP